MARLLVIDDDPHIRNLFPRLAYNLVGSALEVKLAADLAEAQAILRAGPVNLALSDYFMPELDGPELLARLRAANPTLRAMLMTGDAQMVGRILPGCEVPVRDKANLDEVVREAVELALEGL